METNGAVLSEQEALEQFRAVVARRGNTTPPGLLPTVQTRPSAGPNVSGAGHFTVSITGEGFGGPLSVPFTIPPHRMAPHWAKLAFSHAQLSLLESLRERAHATREARPEGGE